MSDKTLFNQNLVLNQLTVNNSTDSNSSGYVAKSTTITPEGILNNGSLSTTELILTNPDFPSVSLNNFSGIIATPNSLGVSGSISSNSSITASTNLIITNGVGSPNDVALSCPQNDVLNVGGSVIATNLALNNSDASVSLTPSANNTLAISSTVQTPTLSVSSGGTFSGITNNTITVKPNAPGSLLLYQGGTSTNNVYLSCPNQGQLLIGGGGVAGSLSVPIYTGGMLSTVWTPASPIACAPGLYTGVSCNIQGVPASLNVGTCAFFFQVQSTNAQGGCVPVVVPSYNAVLNGTVLTLTIYISVANGTNGAAVNSINILMINASNTSTTAP